MDQLTTVGIDLAKDVFATCVLDATGAVLQRHIDDVDLLSATDAAERLFDSDTCRCLSDSSTGRNGSGVRTADWPLPGSRIPLAAFRR
ncbi:hypothetical protein [Paraburkholderia caledonica]|uniref:hypothetical protein n=1 Tax=Paraburkholderia caledonica TaxID=134536 RepID=UPI0038B71EB1